MSEAFACRLRPHIDVAVVGIADESVPTPLKFAIQLVEQMLLSSGESGRPVASLPCVASPVHLPSCRLQVAADQTKDAFVFDVRASRDMRMSWLTDRRTSPGPYPPPALPSLDVLPRPIIA